MCSLLCSPTSSLSMQLCMVCLMGGDPPEKRQGRTTLITNKEIILSVFYVLTLGGKKTSCNQNERGLLPIRIAWGWALIGAHAVDLLHFPAHIRCWCITLYCLVYRVYKWNQMEPY